MSLLTPWGYTLTNDMLANILSEDEFDALTAGKYIGDMRTYSELSSVSQAIRNYCGWHVYPEAECSFSTTFYDRRITQVGSDILIQLPARFVTNVSEVEIGGTAVPTYVIESNGLLHIYAVGFGYERFAPLSVTYTAGVPESFVGAIKELAAHRITHALAQSYGVQSESAGGVSITYASWASSAQAASLPDDNKEVLAPYRLQGVF